MAVVLAVALTGGYVQPGENVRAATIAAAIGGRGVSPGASPSAYATGTSGDGSAQLSFPWTVGETWRMTGGPHSETGKGRPWSALDFQPKSGESGRVRAARAGRVSRPCPNLVQVRHEGGWTTSYYHLKNIPVRDGQWVRRGDVLGWTSSKAGCGGFATGPHLHFSLIWKGSYVNIRGMAIGGWTAREAETPYRGCLVRSRQWQCAPGGLLRNSGLVGAD